MTNWKSAREAARRTVAWPSDATIAMSIGVALEAFDNQSHVALQAQKGTRDAFSLSYGEYGVRTGVWRLLDLFDEYGVHASFSISGKIAADWPQVVAAIADAGHDVVGHGWVNDRFMNEAGEEGERRTVADTLDAIQAASGVRPTGWASPANSSTDKTPDIMLDAGITWLGDDASDDVPFLQDVGDRVIAVLPKANMAANDFVHWIMPNNGTEVFFQGFRDQFDTCYAEGLAGFPSWTDIVLHCHMAGRPSFIPTLRRTLEHAKAHENVWWCTKQSMADWVLSNPEGFQR
ncbi:polysaccharide deacetylase family protein [Microbacterium immunditiarum]|uniref:Peptidoglycan/xylan/chitin deacetylase (PgdA/CDA1 family) n=1 Tax=Microbacterium immunditiarum TaxID=337480 RepID=A0A7Y9GRW9_9MICO|nr:polysaccharide deacetylase family protein [Microbacterium immunditiarum]NYE21539.1 peptidoglycan/xylan/chitin deacetylase (PgdA/CDA1 family) [Microbacterium immunditiarum]